MAGARDSRGSGAAIPPPLVPLREDFIHYHARRAVRTLGWELVAGQYPSGSDDDLPCLNVVDPSLARDQSPDHRRHSANKLVPDLVARRGDELLVVEMKPLYDPADEAKLLYLAGPRRPDFDGALDRLIAHRRWEAPRTSACRLHLCLGFTAGFAHPRNAQLCYLTVDADGGVDLDGAGHIPSEQVPPA